MTTCKFVFNGIQCGLPANHDGGHISMASIQSASAFDHWAISQCLEHGDVVFAKTACGDWVRIQAIRANGEVQAHHENFPYFGDPNPSSWFVAKDLEIQ